MSDEKFFYHPFKRGQQRPVVKILLRKKGKYVESGGTEEQVPAPPRGVLPGQAGEDLFIPQRRQQNISFHDWATRLRSVPSATVFDGLRFRPAGASEVPIDAADKTSEYVEIAFEALGTYAPDDGTSPARIILPDEVWTAFDKALLGARFPVLPGHESDPRDNLDPFGFATINGSGRKVTVCQDVTRSVIGVKPSDDPNDDYQDMEKGQVRFFYLPRQNQLTGADYFEGNDTYIPGYYVDPTTLARVTFDKWDQTKEEETDEDERWNLVNVVFHVNEGAKAKKHSVKPVGGPGLAFGVFPIAYDVGPEGRPGTVFSDTSFEGQGIGPGEGLYEGFVTTDKVRFKVTTEPRFEAAEKTYVFKGPDNRVYLRPAIRPWLFASHDEDNHVVDVAKVWASRLPIYPSSYQFPPASGMACLARRSPLVDFAALPGSSQEIQGLAILSPLPAGHLVAAIAQGGTIYYIWRRVDRGPNTVGLVGLNGLPWPLEDCTV